MKKASKVDYFAILHPLVLIILPAMAYLILHMLKTILFTFLYLLIDNPIVKQDDSFLIVFLPVLPRHKGIRPDILGLEFSTASSAQIGKMATARREAV